MPRKFSRRFKKKRAPRRRFNRKFKKGAGSHGTALTNRFGPVPKYFNTKLKFTVIYTQAAIATINGWNVSMNDLTDPGIGLSATRPVYFTDLMTMYGRFCVHASKIHLVGSSQSDATAAGDGIIGVFPSISAAQAANPALINDCMSQPNAKWAMASRYANIISRVKSFCKLNTFLGLHYIQDNQDCWGQSSTSPTTLPVWRCFAGTQNQTSNYGFNCVIHLTYYVTFMRRDNESQP